MDVIVQESLWFVDMGLSYDEVEAVTSLHHVLDAWSSSPYAHDCRPEQGETEVGADPAQCGWISLSPLLWQEWSQSLVERGCQVPHFAWGGENQGRKWAMFHFNDALLIFSFLGVFLMPEAWLVKVPFIYLLLQNSYVHNPHAVQAADLGWPGLKTGRPGLIKSRSTWYKPGQFETEATRFTTGPTWCNSLSTWYKTGKTCPASIGSLINRLTLW